MHRSEKYLALPNTGPDDGRGLGPVVGNSQPQGTTNYIKRPLDPSRPVPSNPHIITGEDGKWMNIQPTPPKPPAKVEDRNVHDSVYHDDAAAAANIQTSPPSFKVGDWVIRLWDLNMNMPVKVVRTDTPSSGRTRVWVTLGSVKQEWAYPENFRHATVEEVRIAVQAREDGPIQPPPDRRPNWVKKVDDAAAQQHAVREKLASIEATQAASNLPNVGDHVTQQGWSCAYQVAEVQGTKVTLRTTSGFAHTYNWNPGFVITKRAFPPGGTL